MKKIVLLISIFLTFFGISNANEVNIFSARHYDSDIQLYEKFGYLKYMNQKYKLEFNDKELKKIEDIISPPSSLEEVSDKKYIYQIVN